MRVGILEDNGRDREGLTRLVEDWAKRSRVPAHVEAYADAPSFLAAALRGGSRAGAFDLALLDCYLGGGEGGSADGEGGVEDGPAGGTCGEGGPADSEGGAGVGGRPGEGLADAPTGLGVARSLRAGGCTCAIVFTTVSRDFAVEGYEVGALGYLLKPVAADRLEALLDCAAQAGSRTLPKKDDAVRRLALQTTEGPVSLDPELLQWVRSQSHYLEFHLRRGHVLRSRMTFAELLRLLDGDARFRVCARGYLVNLDEVTGIVDCDCVLGDGGRVPISRARLADTRAAYMGRVFERMRGQD